MAVSSKAWISLVLVVPRPETRRSLPTLKLNNNQPAEADHAALVIAAPPDRPVRPVSMDATVTMDSQANREIVARKLPIRAKPEAVKNNAPVVLRPVTPVRKDPADPMDPLAMLEPRAMMDNQAVLVQPDHPARPAIQEMRDLRVPLATLAKPPKAAPEIPARPDPMANQALLAQLVNPADPARTVVPAVQALPAMLVLQALPAKQAVPAVQAIQVTLAFQAIAHIAHRLVWLQVFKRRRRRAQFGGNTEYRTTSIDSKIRSNDFFSPKFISASFCLYHVTFQF